MKQGAVGSSTLSVLRLLHDRPLRYGSAGLCVSFDTLSFPLPLPSAPEGLQSLSSILLSISRRARVCLTSSPLLDKLSHPSITPLQLWAIPSSPRHQQPTVLLTHIRFVRLLDSAHFLLFGPI